MPCGWIIPLEYDGARSRPGAPRSRRERRSSTSRLGKWPHHGPPLGRIGRHIFQCHCIRAMHQQPFVGISPSTGGPRVALRPRRQTSRRFDVARLVGDQLFSEGIFNSTERLSPATRSYSYRQKAQRTFAAELLSPWETVRDMLSDDYSPENQEQIAEYFTVSPLTINTLVANNVGSKLIRRWKGRSKSAGTWL